MKELIFLHWWILAGVLIFFELLSLSFYLICIALSAAVTGLVQWVFPGLLWEWQCLVFVFCALLILTPWHLHCTKIHRKPRGTLNHRATQYLGQKTVLETALRNGQGSARFGDTMWLVYSEKDLPAGTLVTVTGNEGTVLRVSE